MKNLPNKHDHEGSYIVLFSGRRFERQTNELPIQPPEVKENEKRHGTVLDKDNGDRLCGRDRKGDPF